MKDKSIASPLVIDNYIQGWTGGTGKYLMQVADAALRRAGVLPDPVKPSDTLSDIPVVKAFVVRYPSGSAQSIQDFYERFNKSTKVNRTIDALAAQGDDVNLLREMDANKEHLIRLDGIIKETLSAQSQLIRPIYRNPEMRPEEKRQLIDSIYGQMIEVARSGNEALDIMEGSR